MHRARCRLRRRYRLLSSKAFQRVFDRPIPSKSAGLTVLARANDRGYPRLGMIISKRVSKKATARNRLRRLARESFRHHMEQLDSLDVVVIARPELRDRTNAEIFTLLQRHWGRLARWQGS